MESFWEGREFADSSAVPEQRLADGWTADLDSLIARRLTHRRVEERLARITGSRRWSLRRLVLFLSALWAGIRSPARRLQRVPASSDSEGPDLQAGLEALPAIPIEQLAHDLRRLDRQRRTGPMRNSEVALAAVLRAYDARLRLACHCLGVDEHLQPLEGVDRDIERLRIEEMLAKQGISLR